MHVSRSYSATVTEAVPFLVHHVITTCFFLLIKVNAPAFSHRYFSMNDDFVSNMLYTIDDSLRYGSIFSSSNPIIPTSWIELSTENHGTISSPNFNDFE